MDKNMIFIANLGRYNEGDMVGDWFELGQDEDELNTFLKEVVGIDEAYEEWFIADTDLCDLKTDIDEYDDIFKLNRQYGRYEELNTWEQDIVKAVLETDSYRNLDDVIDNLDRYALYPDIETLEDVGYAVLNDWGLYDLKAIGNLVGYIDLKQLGRDYTANGDMTLTSYGLLLG